MANQSMDQVRSVFEKWKSYQSRPDVCRLTDSRKKLIKARLKEYSSDELCLMIDYIFLSQDLGCRFLRGENPDRKKYLDLTNLLRVTKVPQRIERAFEWHDSQSSAPAPAANDGLDLGFMGRLRGGSR